MHTFMAANIAGAPNYDFRVMEAGLRRRFTDAPRVTGGTKFTQKKDRTPGKPDGRRKSKETAPNAANAEGNVRFLGLPRAKSPVFNSYKFSVFLFFYMQPMPKTR
jgi:hypothetical protein